VTGPRVIELGRERERERERPRSRPRPGLVGIALIVIGLSACSESVRSAREDAVLNPAALLDGQVPLKDPGAVDVTVDVRTDADVRAISPLIYGTSGPVELDKTRQTLVRAGGNRYTAYNWETNASNAGSDYQFQNDGQLSDSNEPAKPILELVHQAHAHGAVTLVTVPIGDYVAADKQGGGDVRNTGASYLQTRFKRNRADKGAPLAGKPDPTDPFVYQDEFVGFLRRRTPPKSRVVFSLDNEPEDWSTVHAEVHPRPMTYAELWDRNYRFARAIKRAWPAAEVLGPVSYGWSAFMKLQNASDAHDRDFFDFYLEQAKTAAGSGKRLIDYLDVHWYPEVQVNGARIGETAITPEVVAARVQAPRSLWDPTYEESSWVREAAGGPIDLIHRLTSKIDAHYPGTKLAFSEWNFGAGNHISGAIATADTLGIFGREGVGLASLWPLSTNEAFTFAALRAYRNYDGKGAAFGDTSVRATSSDVNQVTAYASLKAGGSDQLSVIAINKSSTPKVVGLFVVHSAAYKTARIYELSGTAPELVRKPDLPTRGSNMFRLALPGYSVSVIVPSKS
jgi:hypothetical protein